MGLAQAGSHALPSGEALRVLSQPLGGETLAPQRFATAGWKGPQGAHDEGGRLAALYTAQEGEHRPRPLDGHLDDDQSLLRQEPSLVGGDEAAVRAEV